MAKEIKFNIKLTVDGKEQLVSATTSVKDLRAVMDGSRTSAEKLRGSLMLLNQKVLAVQNITGAIQQVTDNLASLTEENRAFTMAMRQTNTLAGKDEGGFEKMRDQVKDLVQANIDKGMNTLVCEKVNE